MARNKIVHITGAVLRDLLEDPEAKARFNVFKSPPMESCNCPKRGKSLSVEKLQCAVMSFTDTEKAELAQLLDTEKLGLQCKQNGQTRYKTWPRRP